MIWFPNTVIVTAIGPVFTLGGGRVNIPEEGPAAEAADGAVVEVLAGHVPAH